MRCFPLSPPLHTPHTGILMVVTSGAATGEGAPPTTAAASDTETALETATEMSQTLMSISPPPGDTGGSGATLPRRGTGMGVGGRHGDPGGPPTTATAHGRAHVRMTLTGRETGGSLGAPLASTRRRRRRRSVQGGARPGTERVLGKTKPPSLPPMC